MRSTCLIPRLVHPELIFFLLLFSVSLAQKSSRVSGPSDCQFQTITAREPNRKQVSEAGYTEFWDSGEKDELKCAGVQVVRHTIKPKGLLLPYYPNTPELFFVVQGQGIQGTVLPGCEETFETSFRSEDGREQVSKHQRVYRYKEGDVLALPAGAVHWTSNDGDTPIIVVALRDTSNVANQLDRKFRKFFLAGKPQSQEQEGSNMFAGFTEDFLIQVYGTDSKIVSQLKGLNDDRGLIVLAENFKVVIPEEQSFRGAANNLAKQLICSTQLSASISNPTSADVFNPSGGRVTNLNGNKLPILKSFQLNAERGVLYKNAVLAPHFNLNAHSIMYITSGSARLQIVRSEGIAVFDEVVKTGQLIVVPQSFPAIMKAGEEGCEWVAFKTNDNAITAQLVGRFSYIRSLPEKVLANAYKISPKQAKILKYNRKEGVIFSPCSGSRSLVEEAKNIVLNVGFD